MHVVTDLSLISAIPMELAGLAGWESDKADSLVLTPS